ncbi:MAG: phosphoesterase, partial [Armatimonadetes bacterium]|nr:phosphoesterase [Armatimonadota bacterium]
TFGDDPLTYSSSGFLWDRVLDAGLSFRNYGEFDYAEPVPRSATFLEIFRDWQRQTNRIAFSQQIGVERLRHYSCRDYPGWNMKIPDVLRADRFLKELAEFERNGRLPHLTLLYLPSDHTSGTTPGAPTPRAQMADNDLALGRVVEALSRSRFWPRTVLFVIEDDPQNGFDHVDGHRSLCLVISPYSRRRGVVSSFYNQAGILHTITRILGVPPLNQMDALAPTMEACFTARPALDPYLCRPVTVPLDELNPPLAVLSGAARHWALASLREGFARVDEAEEDTLNRILWHTMKGMATPYPRPAH